MTQPLMPKATAVWLVDNTSLTFDQIAEFCSLHPLEVKGIADGDVALGIKGLDPVAGGQLSREEIEKAQADPAARLKMLKSKHVIPPAPPRKGPKYTPLSRRQDRPDAIAWLVRNHPELSDTQVSKLVGTTKPTIESVRNRSHWNSSNIKPVDPVTLGLCTQMELDAAVQKGAARAEREAKKRAVGDKAGTLKPAKETVGVPEGDVAAPMSTIAPAPKEVEIKGPDVPEGWDAPLAPKEEEPALRAEDVFGKTPEPKAEQEEPMPDPFAPAAPADDQAGSEKAAEEEKVDEDNPFAQLKKLQE